MLFKFCLLPLLFICLQIITMNHAQAQYAQVDANASASFNAGIQAQAGAGVDAGSSLYGTGVLGGVNQGCSYEMKVAKGAVDEKDAYSEIKFEINKRKLDNKFKEKTQESLTKRMDFYRERLEELFKPEISEFIVNVHIKKLNLCTNYKTHPKYKCPITGDISAASTTKEAGPAPKSAAPDTAQIINSKCSDGSLDPVPPLLKDKWITADGAGYCAASINSSKGSISSSLCSDISLKTDTPRSNRTSPNDCSKYLAEYRKIQIEYENAQAVIDKNNQFIEAKEIEIADAKQLAELEKERRKLQTESTPCPTCDAQGRQTANLPQTASPFERLLTGAAGVLFMGLGKSNVEASLETCAQLGGAGGCIGSSSSAGFPYYAIGGSALLSAAIGRGAFGCGGTFSGLLNGLSGLGGRGGTPYSANGGAFSYPLDMYGNPIGGGRFRPGFDINGNINGLNGLNGNGQLNAGYQLGPNGTLIVPGVNSPLNGINGSLINCFAPPCPQNSGDWGLNGQLGLNGNGYLNSPQYQLQLMQQRQAMLQQQALEQEKLAKYYEAQAQAQMQAYQRQQVVQQQAALVTQQIQALQLKLQTLMYSNSSTGGSFLGGAGLSGGASVGAGLNFGINVGAGFNIGVGGGGGANFNTGNTTIGQPNINNGPPTATVPGGSSPGTIRGR